MTENKLKNRIKELLFQYLIIAWHLITIEYHVVKIFYSKKESNMVCAVFFRSAAFIHLGHVRMLFYLTVRLL